MVDQKNPWDVDGSEFAGVIAPDGGILFPDHGAFQFEATAPAAAASDWSDVAVDIDFVDDTLQFSDTTTASPTTFALQDLNSAEVGNPTWNPGYPAEQTASQDDPDRTSSLPFDELSALYPGIVWPPFGQTSSTNGDGIAPPDALSQDDTGIQTLQATGPAGLDWQVTPDFDDDPGWYPGWIPSSDQAAPRTDDGFAPTSFAVTSSADEPPATRDETQTLSLTLAQLNEQYPGIVWPANWWLL